jgi:hypothetical protein
LLCLGAAIPPAWAAAVDPTGVEQLFVYELNRARHDPPAWAHEMGIDTQLGGDGSYATLVGVAPRMPLALNGFLVSSARGHAQEMATYDYFDHRSAVDGRWPNQMARDAGYPLPYELPAVGGGFWLLPDGDAQTNGNQIESIAAGFGGGIFDYANPINALAGLIVDDGTPSLGHRVHLLAMDDFNVLFREIGTGFGSNVSAMYENYWSAQTGVIDESDTFLTGVVYADANANHLYDVGEGLGREPRDRLHLGLRGRLRRLRAGAGGPGDCGGARRARRARGAQRSPSPWRATTPRMISEVPPPIVSQRL